MEHESHESSNDTNEEKIIYKELSFRIMEAVFEVHDVLGPGYSEKFYERALCKEFRDRGIRYVRQKEIEVNYKGESLGEYKLDLIVEDKINLEVKAVSELIEVFESQVISYLKATGMRLGILINFGTKKVEYKRIVK